MTHAACPGAENSGDRSSDLSDGFLPMLRAWAWADYDRVAAKVLVGNPPLWDAAAFPQAAAVLATT